MTVRSTNHYLELVRSGTPILDVRAPVEFAAGHLPNSHNLPLLDDAQRHQVGLMYREQGQNAAIDLGETLVSGTTRDSRIGAWSAFIQQHPDAVVCCLRGGLRSQTAQRWLHEACDIQRPVVDGGYKALRQFLLAEIESVCAAQRFILVGGYTGSGKTHMLARILRSVDLEGLAGHRGSAFGGLPGGQPSQACFDNALAIALIEQHQPAGSQATDSARALGDRPIVLEHESAMIGAVSIPKSLRTIMECCPIAVVNQSLSARVQQIRTDYIADLLRSCECASADAHTAFDVFSEHLCSGAMKIRKRLGDTRHRRLMGLLNAALEDQQVNGDLQSHDNWIHMVLTEYYDPMYAHQLRVNQSRVVFQGTPDAVIDWLNRAN